jgi:hypothetical protein
MTISGRSRSVLFFVSIVAPTGAYAQAFDDMSPAVSAAATPLALSGNMDKGTFGHEIPLPLPPGRQGVQPNLKLVYQSNTQNGLVGVGWSLSSLPAIGRMPYFRGVDYESNDMYTYLGGGYGSSAHPNNALMRTLSQNYRLRTGDYLGRYTPHGSCGDGPCYWTYADGSGNLLYYGGDEQRHAGTGVAEWNPASPPAWPPAMIERFNGSTGGRGIALWALTKFVDIHGNAYTVTYEVDGDAQYPQHIVYTLGPAPSGLHSVDFIYEPRTDGTGETRYTKRLKRIDVSSGVLTRNYSFELDYALSASTARSRLLSVQRVKRSSTGSIEESLPAHTFDWSESPDISPPQSPWIARDVNSSQLMSLLDLGDGIGAWTTLVGDVNGDGRDDVVRSHLGANGSLAEYSLAGPDGELNPMQVAWEDRSAAYADGTSHLHDLNGDGMLDLIIVARVFTRTPEQTRMESILASFLELRPGSTQ